MLCGDGSGEVLISGSRSHAYGKCGFKFDPPLSTHYFKSINKISKYIIYFVFTMLKSVRCLQYVKMLTDASFIQHLFCKLNEIFFFRNISLTFIHFRF